MAPSTDRGSGLFDLSDEITNLAYKNQEASKAPQACQATKLRAHKAASILKVTPMKT